MTLLKKLNQALADDKIHVSFEYFAPKTQKGIISLNNRICRMKYWNPLWIDVTWGAGGKSGGETMKICQFAKKFGGLQVNMHLTCTNMPKSKIDQALAFCKENSIYNILALRGDKPIKTDGLEEGYFAHATDLIEYIRKQYGDTFCISVAGYPEVHPESPGIKQDIKWLKQKINKGADFIITQLFLDAKDFIQYVKLCREEGITCPIIPGVMPFVSYNNYQMVIKLSSIKVQKQLDQMIQAAKDNDELVKKIGIDWALKICRQLEAAGMKFYHIYTMNQEYSTDEILKELQLVYSDKDLPFMKHEVGDRKQEAVRPIFWANRQFSYIERTKDWDEFPNGRWGKSGEATFSMQDSYPSFGRNIKNKKQREQLCKLWGEAPTKLEDICMVFVKFLEGKIPHLPWSEMFSQVKSQTKLIETCLFKLNLNGFLTTNSQPRVNGLPSTDKTVGWGPEGGYIYQKQYLQFFCPSKIVNLVIDEIKKYKNITYQAINNKNEQIRNCEKNSVNAVTWGVFPGLQVKQPTVVDHETFLVWKEEAFSLWINEWKAIYQTDSAQSNLIQKIHDDFYLVNLCDNDFVHGNLFKIIQNFIDQNQESIKKAFSDFVVQ